MRALRTVAGLLSAGLLVLGVVLLVAQLLAPGGLRALGALDAAGPGWGRVSLHLGVGVVSELLGLLRRRRLPPVAGVVVDLVVVVAVVLVLVSAWWR